MTTVTYQEIDDAYRALQPEASRLGWRFLMTPETRATSASVVILTLNPGGCKSEEPKLSVEGNGYFEEDWHGRGKGDAPLQRQMRRLMETIGSEADDACIGYLVPFRSPSWKDLKNPSEALDFGIRLWQRVLAASPARLVVLMGCHRYPEVRRAFALEKSECHPTGWGNILAHRWRVDSGRTFLGLPHLSRFQIFGRSTSDSSAFYQWLKTTVAPQAPA